ncbi:Cytochrome c oxidase subunit Vb [Penicillium chermesinum]|uniref:Cytochrome c oxidase subunit Vb n=1 Tax=Penicillium chermesinum TaxID=63820 RepID=A0A9W9NYP5_9EURO|nr:Cytochrome c oxidase subunit Vb [Penicillium chermesinum]KAJ5232234.1 Cytochrome c oxidase subunit Vb [Penicillium chermesinum]
MRCSAQLAPSVSRRISPSGWLTQRHFWSLSIGSPGPAGTNQRARQPAAFKPRPPNLQTLHPPSPSLSTPNISSSTRTMFLQRTASALVRRTPARALTLAQRPFSSAVVRRT